MGLMSFLFGKKRGPKRVKLAKRTKRPKRSVGRRPKAGLSIIVRGRKRKLYRGKNGGLYYRTKSGKTYIKKGRRSVGKRMKRRSPGKRKLTPAARAAYKRRAARKLKQTPAARKARAAYRRRAARMGFGCTNPIWKTMSDGSPYYYCPDGTAPFT